MGVAFVWCFTRHSALHTPHWLCRAGRGPWPPGITRCFRSGLKRRRLLLITPQGFAVGRRPWPAEHAPIRMGGQPNGRLPTFGAHAGVPHDNFGGATFPKPRILPSPALSLIISDLWRRPGGILTIPVGYTKVYNLRWSKPLNRPPEVSNSDQTGSRSAQNRSKKALPILPRVEKTALALAPRGFLPIRRLKKPVFRPPVYTIV